MLVREVILFIEEIVQKNQTLFSGICYNDIKVMKRIMLNMYAWYDSHSSFKNQKFVHWGSASFGAAFSC